MTPLDVVVSNDKLWTVFLVVAIIAIVLWILFLLVGRWPR